MDLGRQRKRVALYRFNMLEHPWVMSWPGPFKENVEGDAERPASKTSEPTHEFTLVEPRGGAIGPLAGVLSLVQAVHEIRRVYEESSVAWLYETKPVKKKKVLVIPTAAISQVAPEVVLKEKMVRLEGRRGGKTVESEGGRVRGWTATDPSWRMAIGTGKTKWGAKHSLGVQIAAMAWRRMGGRISHRAGSPLPCVLTKLGNVWTASSWRGEVATFGVGLTVEEALMSLVRVCGEEPKLGEVKPTVIEWRDDSSFRVFERHATGWYGPDPT